MKNAWLLRPSPHKHNRIDEFQMNSFTAIGWPGIGSLEGKTREEIKNILSGPPYQYESLELGNAYATVDIFVNQMEVGDLLLIPNGEDIHFCTIDSDYYFAPQYDSNELGYSHQRKVTWLESITRNDLPMDLRKSLRVHRAVADLTKHYETINALAYGDSLPTKDDKSADTYVSVEYPLRPDLTITFSVPKDMTQTESERFGDFIKTLYFV